MATIEVEGKKYKVTETLPYCQAGMPAKFVETADGERVAVKRGGVWTWWTAQDRLQPRGQCVGMSNSGVITPRQQLSIRNPMRDSNKGKG